jgi:hypothetical protein
MVNRRSVCEWLLMAVRGCHPRKIFLYGPGGTENGCAREDRGVVAGSAHGRCEACRQFGRARGLRRMRDDVVVIEADE